MKICTKCKEIKDISFFNKRKQLKSGIRSQCRSCDAADSLMKKDINKIKDLNRINLDREAYRKNKREQYSRLKDSISKKRKTKEYRDVYIAWRKKAYVENIQYRLSIIIRCRLKKILNKKYGTPANYIGCSLDELKSHLESLFQDGMS